MARVRGGLRLYDASQQLDLLDASVRDARPVIPTGFLGIDSLLRRGGLLPGNLVLLGGRTGTRKTTVMVNMMVSMATVGHPVSLVGLDEAPWTYVVKLLSVWSGLSQERIEAAWDEDEGRRLRGRWREFARGRVHLYAGARPSPDQLEAVVEMSSLDGPPAVVFVDYLAQMTRDGDYKYGDNSRLPRLMEDLGIWSTENGVTVFVLHQLSRNDEYGGQNNRNAGHIPVTLTQLKYGGEEQADAVLGTYRPSLHPLAAMPMGVAKEVLGDRFDDDVYWETKATAKKYERSTFLQLLKNRPGTMTEERGIELLSPTESLRVVERGAEEPPGGSHSRDGELGEIEEVRRAR